MSIYYAYPTAGYNIPELNDQIETELSSLSSRYHVPKPSWTWTSINTHFEPLNLTICISDYVGAIWNRRAEYRDKISKLVSWEVAHEFKHYLDQHRFLAGDNRGQVVIRHIERRRLLKQWFMTYGVVPKFEQDAAMFATQFTGMNQDQYDNLYSSLQPWNIPDFVL